MSNQHFVAEGFHSRINQKKYRKNPIVRAEITFYAENGEKFPTSEFEIGSNSPSTDITAEREWKVEMRAAEKFRDALCALGLV